MKEGREGLEQYRALVERVTRQANGDRDHVASLSARQGLPTGWRTRDGGSVCSGTAAGQKRSG